MDQLIKEIENKARSSAYFTGVKHLDVRVLKAMNSVDRKNFVREEDRDQAYLDQPLSIGHGQTISQPFIVALMTHFLQAQESDVVLEVGSGSGYQAAILSCLVKKVFAIEINEDLVNFAKSNLKKSGIKNVENNLGDGNFGLPEKAPFDKIIVSACSNKMPSILLEQLKVGGILIAPKQISADEQMLIKVMKLNADQFKIQDVIPVRFVPLINS